MYFIPQKAYFMSFMWYEGQLSLTNSSRDIADLRSYMNMQKFVYFQVEIKCGLPADYHILWPKNATVAIFQLFIWSCVYKLQCYSPLAIRQIYSDRSLKWLDGDRVDKKLLYKMNLIKNMGIEICDITVTIT